MKIELTAQGSGYFRVFVDGEQVSQHTAEREASERASNEKRTDPSNAVYYDHDYKVIVDAVDVPKPPDPPTPPPEPPPEPPVGPGPERQLIGGWRINCPFARGGIAIDFDSRTLYMVGHAQRNEVLVFDLPEMGEGDDIASWPALTHREIIPGFWTGGYANSLCWWQGKLWVAPKRFYDTSPPSTFQLFAQDGETIDIPLPRQLYSGFVKHGPGLEPLIGAGGYESGQGWGRGPTLAKIDGTKLITAKQTDNWDEMTPREANYSGEPWVAHPPQDGEGRWACDRVYSGGLVLPEGIVYWPYMGTGHLDYARQTITLARVEDDKTYRYVYDSETFELIDFALMLDSPSPVHGQEIDSEGRVYLSIGNQWRGGSPYQVDPAISVFG